VPDAQGALVRRPTELLEAILAAGRKWATKVLGEMDAAQLWETTFDSGNSKPASDRSQPGRRRDRRLGIPYAPRFPPITFNATPNAWLADAGSEI
jgi:hypothetical protein